MLRNITGGNLLLHLTQRSNTMAKWYIESTAGSTIVEGMELRDADQDGNHDFVKIVDDNGRTVYLCPWHALLYVKQIDD